MTRSTSKSFYKDGLQFECQGSGRCCTSRGTYGYVYLTLADRQRMASCLELPTSAFTRKYCERTDGLYHLKDPDKDCAFLKDRRCSVYEGRPSQCRTWPFWPENMNARTWNREIASFCPGVGRGKWYSAEEIEGVLESQSSATVPGRRS